MHRGEHGAAPGRGPRAHRGGQGAGQARRGHARGERPRLHAGNHGGRPLPRRGGQPAQSARAAAAVPVFICGGGARDGHHAKAARAANVANVQTVQCA
eukprot:2781819-Pyramimonas_sp.AAC.1